MKVGNTAFHFAGHEKVAQEQKTVKSAIPELAEQPISVSISKEGYENYRNSVQENGQSLSYGKVIGQRRMLANVNVEQNLNRFEEDAERHQKAKAIINEWQEQVAEIKGGNSSAQSADSISAAEESDSQSEDIRTASDIIREHSPETDKKISGLVSDFWNTRDESYLMQASRVIQNWFSENYSKHLEWFDGEESSKIDTNVEKAAFLPDGRKSFVEIMQENTPDTAKKMQELIHNFRNTREQGFMEKASRLATDWFNENYSKHPEWFNAE